MWMHPEWLQRNLPVVTAMPQQSRSPWGEGRVASAFAFSSHVHMLLHYQGGMMSIFGFPFILFCIKKILMLLKTKEPSLASEPPQPPRLCGLTLNINTTPAPQTTLNFSRDTLTLTAPSVGQHRCRAAQKAGCGPAWEALPQTGPPAVHSAATTHCGSAGSERKCVVTAVAGVMSVTHPMPTQNSGFIQRVYNKAVTAKKCLEKILDHKSKQSKTNLMIKVSIKIQLSIWELAL